MSRIDYAHDSLAEIALSLRERNTALEQAVARQADRIAQLEIERLELERGSEPRIVAEKERLDEAICALEYTLARRLEAGDTSMPVMGALRALGDIANYSATSVAARWLEEALKEMEEDADGSSPA